MYGGFSEIEEKSSEKRARVVGGFGAQNAGDASMAAKGDGQ